VKFADIYDSARPYIACFAILKDGNKIAMVLRKNTGWMDGNYGFPAGKVEYGETFTQGAVREAKEEAGVDVVEKDLEFVHVGHRHALQADGRFQDWVDVYFIATKWRGEAHNAEEHKSERLDWFDLEDLPENIVPAVLDVLERIKRNEIYSEHGWKA
jgi:8-oxo-dGTP diphosphatase